MAARAETRAAGPRPRWFVRVAAVLVALGNLAALPLWFGDPYALQDEMSFGEALLPVLTTLIAGLAEATEQDYEKIERDTDRDYIMGAHEVVEYGVVDRVVSRPREGAATG